MKSEVCPGGVPSAAEFPNRPRTKAFVFGDDNIKTLVAVERIRCNFIRRATDHYR